LRKGVIENPTPEDGVLVMLDLGGFTLADVANPRITSRWGLRKRNTAGALDARMIVAQYSSLRPGTGTLKIGNGVFTGDVPAFGDVTVRVGAREFNIPAEKWTQTRDRYTYYSRRDPDAAPTPNLTIKIDLKRKQWDMTARKADMSGLGIAGFGWIQMFLKIGDTAFGPTRIETNQTMNLQWKR
jgi:hypothetical protein